MAEAPPPPVEATGKPEDIPAPAPSSKRSPPQSSLERFVSENLPDSLSKSAAKTEQTLVRLNKLLSTKSGLDSFLATINYLLYLLSHLTANPPSLHSLTRLLTRITSLLRTKFLRLEPSPTTKFSLPPPSTTPPSPLPLHLTAACNLLTETRTTLRLLNLLPMTLGLRRLLTSSSAGTGTDSEDPILHTLSVTQLASYTIYQLLENTAYLTDRGILPRSRLLRTTGPVGSTGPLYLLACRAWLLAVSLDFAKLYRSAALERTRRRDARAGYPHAKKLSEGEEAEWERRWWSTLLRAGCWVPLAVHFSVPGGLRGVNRGVIGVLGGLAGWEGVVAGWEATGTK